jgi:hypothetical protein
VGTAKLTCPCPKTHFTAMEHCCPMDVRTMMGNACTGGKEPQKQMCPCRYLFPTPTPPHSQKRAELPCRRCLWVGPVSCTIATHSWGLRRLCPVGGYRVKICGHVRNRMTVAVLQAPRVCSSVLTMPGLSVLPVRGSWGPVAEAVRFLAAAWAKRLVPMPTCDLHAGGKIAVHTAQVMGVGHWALHPSLGLWGIQEVTRSLCCFLALELRAQLHPPWGAQLFSGAERPQLGSASRTQVKGVLASSFLVALLPTVISHHYQNGGVKSRPFPIHWKRKPLTSFPLWHCAQRCFPMRCGSGQI